MASMRKGVIAARSGLIFSLLKREYSGVEKSQILNYNERLPGASDARWQKCVGHFLWVLEDHIPNLLKSRQFRKAEDELVFVAGALWGAGLTKLGESLIMYR